jgi:hypothetical protein
VSKLLDKAIADMGGLHATARAAGVTVRSVAKWRDAGHLPRTELTGETTYSARLAAEIAKRTGADETATREALLATAKRKPKK